MSVMINSVRNTVIAILNKNNYGYISPSDFNLYAQQAQLELFMKYFSDYNSIVNKENARMSGTDYADFGKSYSEQMEEFIVTNLLTNTSVTSTLSNVYYLPSLVTTGDEDYMISKILCYSKILASGVNTSVVALQLVDSSANFFISRGFNWRYSCKHFCFSNCNSYCNICVCYDIRSFSKHIYINT